MKYEFSLSSWSMLGFKWIGLSFNSSDDFDSSLITTIIQSNIQHKSFFFLRNLHKGHKHAQLCRFHNILKHYPNQFRKTFFEPKQYEVQIFKLRMHDWIGRKSTLPYRSHKMSVKNLCQCSNVDCRPKIHKKIK
jgi:hypothetical protein